MDDYCEHSVIAMFGPDYKQSQANWWCWMWGCSKSVGCFFCDWHYNNCVLRP